MQIGVEPGKPLAALAVAAHGKMRRIAAAERGVRQAPEMRPVETDLHKLGLHVIDERQIAGVRVAGPMGDETRKLEPFRRDSRTDGQRARHGYAHRPPRDAAGDESRPK